MTKDGVTYRPTPGMLPASVTRSLGLDPHSGEVSGALSSEAIDEGDLALGRWDAARVKLIALDWVDVEADPIELISGEIGEVSIKDGGFSAELKGAAAVLERPVCPSTSPQCRAELGDKSCRVDLAGRSERAVVIETGNGELTLDRTIDERFLLGRLRYLSGTNCGRSTVVISVSGPTIRIRDLPRGRIEAGSRVELREGCNKRLQTCVERFDNAINFRGEPHLPGTDLLTRYPGA